MVDPILYVGVKLGEDEGDETLINSRVYQNGILEEIHGVCRGKA